jgi:hypothetical protein
VKEDCTILILNNLHDIAIKLHLLFCFLKLLLRFRILIVLDLKILILSLKIQCTIYIARISYDPKLPGQSSEVLSSHKKPETQLSQSQ